MAFDPTLEFQVVGNLGPFGDFEAVSGGIPTTAYTTHFEAGVRFPTYVPGTHEYSDITLERAYKPDRDASLFEWDLANRTGAITTQTCTIRIQNQIGALVNSFVHPSCKLVSVERPGGTAGSSNTAKVRVHLKVEGQL